MKIIEYHVMPYSLRFRVIEFRREARKGGKMKKEIREIREIDERALNRKIDKLWNDKAKMSRLARDVFGLKKIDERA